MSIPDPPWKKKTRPCPFYSQGRCVFSESCGFLHDVKVKTCRPDAKLFRGSTSSMSSFVNPPLTIAIHSPTSSCSPPRSPRMASLLSALQDIIGPDSLEKAEPPLSTGEILSLDVSDASHLPPDTMQGSEGVCSGKLENVQVGHATGQSPPPCGTDRVEKEGDFPDVTSCSTDKDVQGDFASPPGLLSPVQIGSVPLIPFPHTGLGDATARDNSVDSGFAETWVGPTPFSLSPPQLNHPSSTLDLLSSPFGSPLSRVLPRRFLLSPGHQQTSPPVPRPRDSIDIVSPPSFFATSPQHILPSHTSPLSINSTPAAQVRQPPPHALPSGQVGAEDTDTSNGIFDESDQSMGVLVGSPVEGLLFPMPSGEVTVLDDSIPIVSYENLIDPQLVVDENPDEESPARREGAPYVVNGTVEGSPVSGQCSWGKINHADVPLPSPTPSEDIMATSPPHPTIILQYPIPKETTSEDEEFDYEALYQSLMSPEEVASKRMSSPSPLSPRSLPPRAASTGSHPLLRSTPPLVDIPERPHSTVDILLRSRHQDLGITPVLLSEHTSHTSSPLLETPISSSPSQADASARSVNASPVSLSALGLVAHGLSSTSSKHARLSTSKSPPQPAPIAGPSREVAFTLNDRYESKSVRSKWNHICASKKVPFGFRNSSCDGRPPPTLGPGIRKRLSVLTSLPPKPLIDGLEIPGSAHSISSEPSRPGWARPLHLPRPSEIASTIHYSNLYRESLPSAIKKLSDPSHPQTLSLSPSSSHSSQSGPIRNIYPTHYIPSLLSRDIPQSAPLTHAETWRNSLHFNTGFSTRHRHSSSRPLRQPSTPIDDDASEDGDPLRTFTQRPVPLPSALPTLRPASSRLSLASISSATPERTLMFAIASDSTKSVLDVLEHDRADPNEPIGPQSALAFALTNERLSHKLEIVKALLAHGADPAALRNPELNPPHRGTSAGDDAIPPLTTTREAMDPATRYYVARADALQTRQLSALLQESSFRPLGRVRYDIVGQDQVFEHLFTVLNQHSRAISVSPLVVLLCGPSGHGKSFLARRFGSLLGVPTHTVNVTTLRSTHDLWDSYSMSPYDEMSTIPLSQFLLENEGKRCVVVIDEIEKVEDPKVLHSLLMPWELGRCSPQAGHRHIDVRQVIWLGTSNIGHEFVFEFCDALSGRTLSREEYQELVRVIRSKISQSLGASLSSRITTVLPFVPFSEAELMAIATETLYSFGGERAFSVSSDAVERVSRQAIQCYIPEEGVRSLHRAVSSLLTDMSEFL